MRDSKGKSVTVQMSKKNRKSSIVNSQSAKWYLSMAAAQRLGFEFRDIAEADKASGLSSSLAKYFRRHRKVRAAYDRGRLLRYLVELAPVAIVHDAARKLKDLGFEQFEKGQDLRDFLDGDIEANELWETARVNGWIDNRQALQKTASDGNPKAIMLMEKWAVDRQQEKGQIGPVNFKHLGTNQMAELFGTSRQTIHEWWTQKGLPQNIDGSFDLYRAIPWYEEFVLKKSTRGREAVGPLNPFQAVKTERERLRLETERGELIERGAVIGFQVAMIQNLVNGFNAITDLANRIFGQPREEIVARLEDFRDDVTAKLQHVPGELKLSKEAKAKLTELYEILKPRMNTNQHKIKPQRTQSDTEK